MNAPNPFARDHEEAERLGLARPYLAHGGVTYLRGVGALEYLRGIGGRLSVVIPAAEAGMVPYSDGHRSPLAAFATYAAVERSVLAALDGCNEAERAILGRQLAHALPRALQVRANLLAKGQRVPGRDVWLRAAKSVPAGLPRVGLDDHPRTAPEALRYKIPAQEAA